MKWRNQPENEHAVGSRSSKFHPPDHGVKGYCFVRNIVDNHKEDAAGRPWGLLLKVAACLIVKNDVFRIAEWLAYHKAIGFDALIVYDNNSDDGTTDVLLAAAHVLDVRVIFWERNDPYRQSDAYSDAAVRYPGEFDWIAFIDADEFVVPHVDDSIQAFLARYPNNDAVMLHWAMFGSSGHIQRPDGLLIENFTKRSDGKFRNTRHVKSIVRPESITRKCYNPHVFDVKGIQTNTLGQIINWEKLGIAMSDPVYDFAQINHYYVRSKEEWIQKIERGWAAFSQPKKDPESVENGFRYADINDVEDESARRFLEKTKGILAQIPATSNTPRRNTQINTTQMIYDDDKIRLLIDAATIDDQIMKSHKDAFPVALHYIQQHDGPYKAIEFYEKFWFAVDSPIKQLRTCAKLCQLEGSEVVIVTAHGTKIIYSEERNLCYHAERFSGVFDSYVKIEILGSSAALFIIVNGTKFYLGVDKKGDIFIPSIEYNFIDPLHFEIRLGQSTRFTVNCVGKFLSAEPSGNIVCNRSAAKDWELFRVGVSMDAKQVA